MKKISKFLAVALTFIAVAACTEKTPIDDNDDLNNNEVTDKPNQGGNEGDGGAAPELKEVNLTADPSGASLTVEIKATGSWTVTPDDDAPWVTVDPESGTGDATLNFTVDANGERVRSVTFYVKEGQYETYSIFISQSGTEIMIHDGDLAFLQEIVDNKLYGDATPTPDWHAFTGEGFPGINFGVDAANKFYISSINFRANSDNLNDFLTAFPTTVNLQNCTEIYVNYMGDWDGDPTVCPLYLSEFPSDWNCPKLRRFHIEGTGIVGVIPDSFAAMPMLENIFIRKNDIYGALPHSWASTKLESVTLGYAANENPDLGYLIPKSLDIILNSQKNPDTTLNKDSNEFKIGGAAGNWIGFEKGWGQKRYELFDPAAEPGNETVWSDYRAFTEGTAEEVAVGGIRNPLGSDIPWQIDSWKYFYFRIDAIPTELHDWNQAEADAYTARCKANRK